MGLHVQGLCCTCRVCMCACTWLIKSPPGVFKSDLSVLFLRLYTGFEAVCLARLQTGDKRLVVCARLSACVRAQLTVVEVLKWRCQIEGLQMPVRLRAARSLLLTEYPFRVNELGQSLHVRLQLNLGLGRSKRSVVFSWCCHANEPTHA